MGICWRGGSQSGCFPATTNTGALGGAPLGVGGNRPRWHRVTGRRGVSEIKEAAGKDCVAPNAGQAVGPDGMIKYKYKYKYKLKYNEPRSTTQCGGNREQKGVRQNRLE